MKKGLALLLAASMSLSAFSSAALAADPQTAQEKFDALKAKQIFEGYTDGSAGLDKQMTRAEFATVIKRLVGLEEVAGTSFTDLPADHWANGAVEAGVKAGFFNGLLNMKGQPIFNPGGNVTLEQMAKVFAEVLDLEVDANATVEGKTSAWATGYVAAAIEAGLLSESSDYTAPALREALVVASFTAEDEVNSEISATATVNANGTVTIAGETTLAEVTITVAKGEEKAVEEKVAVTEGKFTYTTKALAAGTYTATIVNGDESASAEFTIAQAALNVKSAKAVTNTSVEVTLVDAATAVNAGDFSAKDAAGAALAIESAKLSSDGKAITLKTAAQTTGAKYTLSVQGKDYTFIGQIKDTTKPVANTALAKTNKIVEVKFSENVDAETALNPANYTIDGDLQVTSAVFGSDKKTVHLNTSAQTAGKLYTIKVKNVTDLSGNKMDDAEKKFGGVAADTTKPVATTVVSKDGVKLEVTFNEAETLDATSALNVANYTVEGLTIESAEFKADTNVLGTNPVVVLKTSTQTAGKLYALKVSKVADVNGNVADDKSINFGGTPTDTSKLNLSTAVAKTNTTVELTFDDDVNATLGANVANYTIEGLTVSAAAVDGTKVTLTTSAQTAGKLYTVKAANLTDDNGNALDTAEKKFGGVAADTAAPELSKATAVDKNTVNVVFTEEVNEELAENPANYNISDLGYAVDAELQSDKKTVKLTTAAQALGKIYTIKVSNVQDLSANTIKADSEVKFAGIGDALGKLTVTGATMIDKNTIRVFYNQPVAVGSAETEANYTIVDTGSTGSTTGIAGPSSNVGAEGAIAKVVGDNNDQVLITFPTAVAAESGKVYKLSVAGVTGKYGAVLDTDADETEFAGVSTDKADLKIDMAQAIDKRTVEFTFNNDLGATAVGNTFTLYTNEGLTTGAVVGSAASVSGKKVTVVFASDLTDNTVYYLNLAAGNSITDISTLQAAKIDAAAGKYEAIFATAKLDAPSLSVTGAVMVDDSTLDIYFNRNIDVAAGFNANGAVVIKDANGTNVVSGAEFKSVEKTADNKLTVYFADTATKVAAGGVYTVELTADANVRLANNTGVNLSAQSDADKRKAQFAGITTAKAEPTIASVIAVAPSKVLVTFSEELNGALDVESVTTATYNFKIYNGSTLVDPSKLTSTTTDNKTFEITLSGAEFAQGVTYTAVVANDAALQDFASLKDVKKAASVNGTENSVAFTGAGSNPSVTAVVTNSSTITVTAANGYAIEILEGTTSLANATGNAAAQAINIGAQTAGDVITVKVTDFAGNVTTTTLTI